MTPARSRATLTAGSYALVCNIAKHYGLGMRAPLHGQLMADADHEPEPHIGWLRAILTAAAIVVVGVVVCIYGANAALTKLHSIDRPQQVALATTIFFVGLFAIAWLLRILQRRKIL